MKEALKLSYSGFICKEHNLPLIPEEEKACNQREGKQ